MSQYKLGTVSVTNGSNVVNGTGTQWLTDNNVVPNNWFIGPNLVIYVISNVVSDIQLQLTAVYGGSTVSGASYVIHRDFGPNGLPLAVKGDLEFEEVYNKMVTQVGTVSQIQAIADAFNASLSQGMTQADFEAVAESNRRKFAGSGFVEMGKHLKSAGNWNTINEGMYVQNAPTVVNTLFLGQSSTSKQGSSLTDVPKLLVDGVIVDINMFPTANESNWITLPPAPDGLDKKDGTGRFADLPVAIAAGGTSLNASVIDRQDLIGMEVWHEDIDTNGVVYPLGDVQYGETTYQGLTLSNTVVAQGYSAFGEWDTVTKGYGLAWNVLSDASRAIFLNRKENNIYRDAETGKLIQVRRRLRSIAGLGQEWDLVTPDKATGNLTLSFNESSPELRVKPRGQLTTVNDLDGYASGTVGDYMSDSTTSTNCVLYGKDKDAGVWGVRSSSNSAYAHNGKCFFIPIALVSRRNQGAYHDVLNENGSRPFTNSDGTARTWFYQQPVDIKAETVSDCFNIGSGYPVNGGVVTTATAYPFDGNIGTTSRRPDGKFYDAIYEGDVKDLRISARRKAKTDLLEEFNRKAINGEVRGSEPAPQFDFVGTATIATTPISKFTFSSTPVTENGVYYIQNLNGNNRAGYLAYCYVNSDVWPFGIGGLIDEWAFSLPYNGASVGSEISKYGQVGNELAIFKVSLDQLSFKELLQCDIIADPANYYSGQDYTNTGASLAINSVQGETVVLVTDATPVGGTISGHYYRRVGLGGFIPDLSTIDYSNTNDWADLGTTYDGQTWTNDGSAQTVDLVVGQVVYNNGASAAGTIGHYYRMVQSAAATDLSLATYTDTNFFADLGIKYRGQQWTNNGTVQTVTVATGDVVFNNGSSVGGVIGNFYKRAGSGFTGNLAGNDYSAATWTDLGPDWNESPAAGSWLQDGLPGFPLLTHADTGASLIPDGTSKFVKASRKVKDSVLTLYSTDNGVTWLTTDWSASLESASNGIQTAMPVGRVYLNFYTTDADFTQPAANAVVDKTDGIWASQKSDRRIANLISSLTGKVSTLANSSVSQEFIGSLLSNYIDPTNSKMYSGVAAGGNKHVELVLGNPSGSPAIKIMPYLTHENGRYYVQILFKELFWDTTKDTANEFTAIDGTVSNSFSAGTWYLIDTGSAKVPVYCVTSIGSTVFTDLVQSKGGEYRGGGSNILYFTTWTGTGWGDDSTFNVVDNTSAVADLNGNLVLAGQARFELPYLTGEDN